MERPTTLERIPSLPSEIPVATGGVHPAYAHHPDAISIPEFLGEVIGDLDAGFVSLFTYPDKRAMAFHVLDFANLSADAMKLAEGQDVYFRVTPTVRCPPVGKLGTAKMAASLGCLWLDVDCRGNAHIEKRLPRSKKKIWHFLSTIPFLPTLVVRSGYGYHMYWVFREPWLLDNAHERRKAMGLSRGFQRTMLALAAREPFKWKLDYTGGLQHLLRLPNTFNHKYDPKLVQAFRLKGGQHYNPEDFELFVMSNERPLRPAPQLTVVPRPEQESKQHAEASEAEKAIFVLAPASIPPGRRLAQLPKVRASCAWLAYTCEHAVDLSYDEWWRQGAIAVRCADGANWFHELSKPDSRRYSVAETDKKIRDLLKMKGPPTCKYLRENGAEPFCSKCPHWGRVKSPIVLGLPTHNARRSRPPDLREAQSSEL